MPNDDRISYAATRKNGTLSRRRPTYQMNVAAYAGGDAWRAGNYLFRYVREMSGVHERRKDRAIYLNYMQPIADVLAGLLLQQGVDRDLKAQSYLLDRDDGKVNFESLMRQAAVRSFCEPVALLMDSPAFDRSQIVTEADRRAARLNPYPVMYSTDRILDFHMGTNGQLEWITFDETAKSESIDPFTAPAEIRGTRLWTRTESLLFKPDGSTGRWTIDPKGSKRHELGEVPVVFLSWNEGGAARVFDASPADDIGKLSRAVYNYMSLLDEQVYASLFKSLFYPLESGNGLPAELTGKNADGSIAADYQPGGVNIAVLPFDGNLSHKPYYEGPGAESVEPLLAVIDRVTKEILSKVGLDKDTEKGFAQSGVAKSLEYRKAHALLTNAAANFEDAEKALVRFAALWEGGDPGGFKIKYPREFDPDATTREIDNLYRLFDVATYEPVQKYTLERIIKQTLGDTPEVRALLKELRQADKPKSKFDIALEQLKNGAVNYGRGTEQPGGVTTGAPDE